MNKYHFLRKIVKQIELVPGAVYYGRTRHSNTWRCELECGHITQVQMRFKPKAVVCYHCQENAGQFDY